MKKWIFLVVGVGHASEVIYRMIKCRDCPGKIFGMEVTGLLEGAFDAVMAIGFLVLCYFEFKKKRKDVIA